jgi:hypothetical protein
MLCPDHVASDKLPEVDPETSLQASIEKKIDKKFTDVPSSSRRKANKAKQKNPFFHGLSGSKMAKNELELVKGFENDDELGPMDPLWFCIPCNFRDDVHAKPPAYKHMYVPSQAWAPLSHVSTHSLTNCLSTLMLILFPLLPRT